MLKSIKDLFAPKPQPYPVPPAASATGAPAVVQSCSTSSGGWLARWFGPTLLDYNLPPAPPVVVPLAMATPASAMAQPMAQAAVTSPTGQSSSVPDATFRAFTFNPSFEPKHRGAEHERESRSLTRDADAVVFTVPDGCDALDLLYGPIEVNPDVGSDEDLEAAVSIGKAKLQASTCDLSRLRGGDQVSVIVPWRGTSRLHLGAQRLRAEVIAHFYNSQQI